MYRKLMIKLLDSKAFNWLAIHILPYIRFSFYYVSLRGDKYNNGYAVLKEGDIIGSIDYKKLTGAIIPKATGGILCHSAYCMGKRNPNNINDRYAAILPNSIQGNGLEMAEMTHLNFTFSDFFDICKEAERVIIFRCVDYDEEYIRRMTAEILSLRYKTYDSAFSLGVEALYCSELIYQADLNAGGRLKCSLGDLAGLGRPYISPDGLLASKNVVVIWDSENQFTGMSGEEVGNIIFKRVEKC